MTEVFEKKIGYAFQQPELIRQALTHKSFAFEQQNGLGHNERLEFLGDAVIDLVLAQKLMSEFPLDDEGALSKKRASLVNEAVLAEIASELSLAEFVRLGKGEIQSGGASRPRILASTYEAIVGACFLDSGYERVQELIWSHFFAKSAELTRGPDFEKDFKTRLQEQAQNLFKITPTYEMISEVGPAHARIFTTHVHIGSRSWSGEGTSKKISEQAAAEKALQELDLEKKRNE